MPAPVSPTHDTMLGNCRRGLFSLWCMDCSASCANRGVSTSLVTRSVPIFWIWRPNHLVASSCSKCVALEVLSAKLETLPDIQAQVLSVMLVPPCMCFGWRGRWFVVKHFWQNRASQEHFMSPGSLSHFSQTLISSATILLSMACNSAACGRRLEWGCMRTDADTVCFAWKSN